MALLLATAALLNGSLMAHAQAPAWDQAVSLNPTGVGGTGSQVLAIATDRAGNRYLTGFFSGSVTFGATTLTSRGPASDLFVAKLDSAGVAQWAVRAGGITNTFGTGIAVAGNGATAEVYITGRFMDTVAFGGTTLVSRGGSDMFVAKLDAAGTFQWATRAGGSMFTIGTGLAVAGSGGVAEIYVTGYFGGSIAFDSIVLTSSGGAAGGANAFVAKLDATGAFQWATRAGGTANTYSNAVAVAGRGASAAIYITGAFQGSASFNTTILGSAAQDVFVAKLDAAGTFQWAAQSRGPYPSLGGSSVAIADSGTTGVVYVTGAFHGRATFGTIVRSGAGRQDVFVAALDATGAFQWVTSAGDVGDDHGASISVEQGGAALYITGDFFGNVPFGATTCTSVGGEDVFVARLDAAGAFQWATRAGGNQTDNSHALAVAGSGATAVVSVGGESVGTPSFGPIVLVGDPNFSTGFVARIAGSPPMGLSNATPLAARLTLWPNPTTTRTVRLALPDGAVPGLVDVHDPLGRLVRHAAAGTDGTLDVRGLPPGLYIVRVGAATARLVLD